MSTKDIIDSLRVKTSLPAFRVGDTVRVHVKIEEGEKERIQVYEGTVIKKRGGNLKGSSFTVRKLSYGIGVERIFPFESASIEKVEVTKRGKVRRSRLFYLRDRKGRAAQVPEREVEKKSSKKKASKVPAKKEQAAQDVAPEATPSAVAS